MVTVDGLGLNEPQRYAPMEVPLPRCGRGLRSGGDPYGPVRLANTPAIGNQPLSWDRRHTLLFSGMWRTRRNLSLGWSSALLSRLPWTPKPTRQAATDIGAINSERLPWNENTNASLRWAVPYARGVELGLEVLPEGDPGHWVPVHDPRLMNAPRTVRMSVVS